MKKVLAVLVSLIVLVIVGLLLVPLFYSLDDMKPRIEQIANEKVRGEIKLGHLSFALFPTVKVGVDDVRLYDKKGAGGEPFGKVANLEVRMSLLSLLGSPKATLRVNGLDMNLVTTDKEDTLANFLLAPTAEEIAAQEKAAQAGENPLAAAQQELSAVLVDVPGFVRDRILKARFSLEVADSHVSSKTATKESKLTADASKFQLNVADIGFNSPIRIGASSTLDVTMDGVKVTGPFSIDGEVTLIPSTGETSELKLFFRQKLDDLAINAMGLLDKKAGTAMGGEVGGVVKFGKTLDANIDNLSFQFGGIRTAGSLALKAEKVETADVDLKISSEKIDLAGLGTLVPMVRDYKLKGESDFRLAVKGQTSNPNLDMLVRFSGISGATPQLAKPITDLKGELTVAGTLEKPLVNLKSFSLKIGRSDLAATFSSEGLEKIVAKANVTSNLLDGDELMGVEPVTAAGSGKGGSGATAQAPAVDPNASLDEVLEEMAPMVEETLKNPMLDKIALTATMNLKAIRFAGAQYTNVTADAKLANRNMTIKTGNVGAYGGRAQADMDLGLKAAALEYAMKAKLDKIQMSEAIKSHAPAWKNAMTGALVGSMNLSGKGLRKTQLAQNLAGHIEGNMENGRLNMPVMQLVTMFVDKLPKQAGDKLDNQEFRGDFKTMKFVADIKGRSVLIKEMNVIYDPNKAKIGDLRFNATGELTFDKKINFNAMAMVSPELVRIGELKGPSGLVEIPMKLTGTMEEPKPDIGYTTKILTERLAKGVAKKELEKVAPKVIEKLQEKAPEPIKKGLEELKKKFKF